MQMLREKLHETSRFLTAVELVSVRGSMNDRTALKTRAFASDLAASPAIDWISITDNAGGNPRLAPLALGRPVLYAGKEVVIHLTCKDLNRNGLESEAWMLNSEGFCNILAMTGDYPVGGSEGLAKPVFDIDSIGLISLLSRMNRGLSPREASAKAQPLEKTHFTIGAVTSSFKLREAELVPQYLKLQKKIECGAQFIISQIGFDSRKISELRAWMDAHGLRLTPLIGNVYVLNSRVAEIFHAGRIPGVVLTAPLAELCRRHAASPDQGKVFFREFAAKQIAVYRGLGFRGAYLGGVHDLSAIESILALERTFAYDDWVQFARELQFSRPGEFFFYEQNPDTLLADPSRETPRSRLPTKHVTVAYQISKLSHDLLFEASTPAARLGARLCAHSNDPLQGPAPLRMLERLSKSVLYECKDCGDCSLPEIAYLCPESQCAKNQRNGPCGGTREGRCEVEGYGDCIWLRAYERLQHDGKEHTLLDHVPVIQNQALRRTSAWANNWLGRDHAAKREHAVASSPGIAEPAASAEPAAPQPETVRS